MLLDAVTTETDAITTGTTGTTGTPCAKVKHDDFRMDFERVQTNLVQYALGGFV